MYKTVNYVLNKKWVLRKGASDDSRTDHVALEENDEGLTAHYVRVIDGGESLDVYMPVELKLEREWVQALTRISKEENFSFRDIIQSPAKLKDGRKGLWGLLRFILLFALLCIGWMAVVWLIVHYSDAAGQSESALQRIFFVLGPVFAFAAAIFPLVSKEIRMHKHFKVHLTGHNNHAGLTAEKIYEELHRLRDIRVHSCRQALKNPIFYALVLLEAAMLVCTVLPDYAMIPYQDRIHYCVSKGWPGESIAQTIEGKSPERAESTLLAYLDGESLTADGAEGLGEAICILKDRGFFAPSQQEGLLDALLKNAITRTNRMDEQSLLQILSRCGEDFRGNYPIFYSAHVKEEMSQTQLAVLRQLYRGADARVLLGYWQALAGQGLEDSAHGLFLGAAARLSLEEVKALAARAADGDERLTIFRAYATQFTAVGDALAYLDAAASYGIKAAELAKDGIVLDLTLGHCIAKSDPAPALPEQITGVLPLIRKEEKETFGSNTEHTEADTARFTLRLDTKMYDALPKGMRAQGIEDIRL